MEKIRILIADDHQLFRAGLKSLLLNAPDIEVVAEANDGVELLEIIDAIKVDVVLMDIDMPGLNGIQATRLINEKHLDVRVVILSMYNQIAFINNLFSAGAKGYLIKSTDFKNLYDAIITVLNGGMYLDTSLAHYSLENMESNSVNELSPQELMIIKYISDGLISKQIADRLSVSPRTIDNYKSRILKKLKLSNSAELITYSIHHGILKK